MPRLTADEQVHQAPIRLVASDLDGTLLRSDGTISARTRAVIQRVRRAGIQMVVVTGRPPRTVRPLVRDLQVADLAICCNGALVYDFHQDAVVAHSPCPPETTRWIVRSLRQTVPGVCFAFEMELRYACEPGYFALARQARGYAQTPDIGDAEELCAHPVTKLIARHPDMAVEDLLRHVRVVAGVQAEASHSGAPFVEISAAGVHKARALADLCGQVGIDRREVLAFGDMPNDLPMLEWAGHAVTVSNAHPTVRAQVGTVTLSNDEDGVALAIERMLDALPTNDVVTKPL